MANPLASLSLERGDIAAATDTFGIREKGHGTGNMFNPIMWFSVTFIESSSGFRNGFQQYFLSPWCRPRWHCGEFSGPRVEPLCEHNLAL